MDACRLKIQTKAITTTKSVSKHPTRTSTPPSSNIKFPLSNKNTSNIPTLKAVVVDDTIISPAFEPGQVEITWQIVFGALAGVTPFVVAGIEFSKRIAEQRECKVCKGSGLVLRGDDKKKYYFRCPACGGFLPWQSWRRFFTG